MSKKFYTSDLHIGHKAILTFDNRPFFTLKEMHEAIIKNWNELFQIMILFMSSVICFGITV